MSDELFKKYRPKRIKDLIGQPEAVTALNRYIRKGIPQTILLSGPSGTGKTTIARILKTKLNCHANDFKEMNCAADFRGIDTAREIRARMSLSALGGKCRIYYLDEIANATTQLQEALLKMLEEPPKHVYFFLATTDPHKLKTTVLSRCSKITLKLISNKDMEVLLNRVLEKEGVKVSDEVIAKIIEVAEGNAREALQQLNKVYLMEDEEEQLAAIVSVDVQKQAKNLGQALIFKPQWDNIREILTEAKDEDPERLRRAVLGYARAVLCGEKTKKPFLTRAALVIECFESHVYDSGHAGIALAAWNSAQTR